MEKSYWKAILVLLLAVGWTHAGDRGPTNPQTIEWQSHYGKARRISDKQNRPVLLFLTMDGCIHCVRMQHHAFRDRGVIDDIRNSFVPARIKISGESSLARDLKVTLYPTTVIIAPDGKILDYARGYLSPEDLKVRMAKAVRDTSTSVASRVEM